MTWKIIDNLVFFIKLYFKLLAINLMILVSIVLICAALNFILKLNI